MYLRIFLIIFFFASPFAKGISFVPQDLILLPEMRSEKIDSVTDPFLTFIDQAEKEILMTSYKLQEKKLPQKDMLEALERAVKRGVAVHVITENRLTKMEIVAGEEKKNASLKAYQTRGVHVYSNLGKFNQSHPKYIVVDGKIAVLGTTNFDKELEGHTCNERPARDFAVKIRNPEIVQELVQAFWCDVKGKDFISTHEDVLWGPDHLREHFKELIESATQSICIYQQDITDAEIIEWLVDAAIRSVHVELLMCPHPFGFNHPDNNIANQKKLSEAGGKVYLNEDLNIHAKVMILDDRVYVFRICKLLQTCDRSKP